MTDRNIYQRLAAVMENVSYVQREKKQGMRYPIVSHDAVTALCRPALLEQGIVYYPIKTTPSQTGNRTEVHMVVRFVNIDDPADHFDVETFGHGVDDSDKGPGKAMSYAIKYSLLKTLGLETGDDPDLDQNTKHHHAPPTAQPAVTARANNPTSLHSYLDTAHRAIGMMENREDLIAWWDAQKPNFKYLDITQESEEYRNLRGAWAARGKALSVNDVIDRTVPA